MTVEELITLLGNIDPKFLQSPIIVEGWGAGGESVTIQPHGFLGQDKDKAGIPLVVLR
jgi:hypothetical protein